MNTLNAFLVKYFFLPRQCYYTAYNNQGSNKREKSEKLSPKMTKLQDFRSGKSYVTCNAMGMGGGGVLIPKTYPKIIQNFSLFWKPVLGPLRNKG